MSFSTNQSSETRSTRVRNLARFGSVLSVFAMLAFLAGCPAPTTCTTDADCGFCEPTCIGGVCGGDDSCTADQVCNETTDSCDECDADASCDDGNDCTDDTCDAGACVFTATAAADACDASDLCSPESCDTATGACVAVDTCAANEVCDPADGSCTTSCTSDADCDACFGETCDVGGTDLCVAGTAVDCDDADACTDDSCLDGVCSNDAVVCPTGETCSGGVCAVDTSCTSDADCDACLGETCDVGGTDNCAAGTPIDCDDGDACTDDSCLDGVCSNDAVICGIGSVCLDGACVAQGQFDFTLADDDTLNGTTGDDVFTASVGTLHPTDIAVGNGGNDTVNAVIVGNNSDGATLIDMDFVNFTTLNNATFDANNSAAIGEYGVSGGSTGDLTLTNVGDGTDMVMGNGFDQTLNVTYASGNSGADPPADFTLTLNGPAAGGQFVLSNDDCASELTVDCAADSSLTSVAPTESFFCSDPTASGTNTTAVLVIGAGDLGLVDAEPQDLIDDGFDFTDFTGNLDVTPTADVGHGWDFSAAGFDVPAGSYTIVDTGPFAHAVLTQAADHDLTVNIGDIDAGASAGAVTVAQSTSLTEFDTLNLNFSGEGAGMGALSAGDSEFINIDSGGTTGNTIADVTGAFGGFSTPTITVTGDQNLTCGDVITEVFNASAATGVISMTALTAQSVSGGSGDDNLTGSPNQDSISGNGGEDTIDAGDGDDVVNGNGGDDTLTGGPGNDLIDGGPGNDDIRYSEDGATNSDTVLNFQIDDGTEDDAVGLDVGLGLTDTTATALIATARGAMSILEKAVSAGATVAGTEQLLKLTDVTGNSFDTAIGTSTITGVNVATVMAVVYYDFDTKEAVVGRVTSADATIGIGDAFVEITRLSVSAADYANLDEDNFLVF